MNSFSQFNIEITSKRFEGSKIKMSKILDREIIVHNFKLEDSKVFTEKGSCKCLYLQISINNEKHVVFTGSTGLIEMIQQIPEDGFPFKTVIKEENERFIFT
jgi:hypothetical protein